jgi:phosphopantothenoylcysteine decarboxylase
MVSPLKGREILLGVTGGIAAYKSAELCSRLVQSGAFVSVIMTESASRFIGATTFEALTGRPVHSEQFAPKEHFRGEHIGLPQRAELIVIAPATAQTIARIAHGMADDLLSTAVLVSTCPKIIAPAMNCDMWNAPAVKRNVELLRADQVSIVDPEDGWLSCGQTGPGRMAEPSKIIEAILHELRDSKSN